MGPCTDSNFTSAMFSFIFIGLALTVSNDTPTSPLVTFSLVNLIAVKELKARCLNACRSISAFSRATSPSVHFVQTLEVSIWSSSTATWRRAEILEAYFIAVNRLTELLLLSAVVLRLFQ